MFSMLASGYFETYARNNKRPKSYKENQRMLKPSVWYGVPSTVDTNSPTYHGTLMGHLGTKSGNLSQQSVAPETTKDLDLPVITC